MKFRVYGIPAPGGSKRGFVHRATGRVIIVEDAKRNKTWRESVLQAALSVAPSTPLTGSIIVTCVFWMPRPKGHFGTGKNAARLKDSAPNWHISKPDATKLWRSTEDALTGLLWRDDCQVSLAILSKRYTSQAPGAEITVEVADERLFDRL
jgi:Holliday junction resolvase RusA-like endonuclease